MNTASRLPVATMLLAALSLSTSPVMAAAPAPAKKAAVQPEEIPLLMPPIVIIGKRMTAEEKIAFSQPQQPRQQRAHAMKKVARKKTEQIGSPALSAL
ncbi:MAG: hypothetical protein NVS3B11_11890 [Collimonas sp.]